MKQSFVVCLIVAVLFGLSSCKDKGRIVEPKDGPARLVIQPQTLNLGTISRSNGVVKKEVLIINEGSENLVINEVENLCSCTHAEYPDHPIRPGHGERMEVYLNAAELSTGQFMRTIIVHSNGGRVAFDLAGTMVY